MNAKDAWLKYVEDTRKRNKKHPTAKLFVNAGNVQNNINMFNHMMDGGNISNNPISGPMGGDVGVSAGVCEDISYYNELNTLDDKPYGEFKESMYDETYDNLDTLVENKTFHIQKYACKVKKNSLEVSVLRPDNIRVGNIYLPLSQCKIRDCGDYYVVEVPEWILQKNLLPGSKIFTG